MTIKRYIALATILVNGICASAQTTIQKYDILPTKMVDVFLDHVQGFPSTMLNIGQDQYFGQVDSKGNIYGYGRYMRSDGVQLFGLFREGKMIQGITLLQNSAMVGDTEHYASYSTTTGQLEYIFKSNHRQLYDTGALRNYKFLSMSYSNGDQYVGETMNGQRHGLGIYYYANGDVWFGIYQNNVRNGNGAHFSQEDKMTIGVWTGEDCLRKIAVRRGKGKKGK